MVSKDIIFCWLPSHNNIRGNELADLEAKSALSLMITYFKIPYSDLKSNIRQYINNKCQSIWEKQTQNKLNEIKPNFNSKCAFFNYSRKEQTKITRCRIGHTRITHSYMLKMNKHHSAFLVTNLLQSNLFLLLVQNLIIFAQNILILKL